MYPNLNSDLSQNTEGKFELPNGLKIYWGKKNTDAASHLYNGYYTSTTSMTSEYPSNFIPQILLVNPDSGNIGIHVDLRAQGTTGVFYMSSSQNHSIAFYWLAIGY